MADGFPGLAFQEEGEMLVAAVLPPDARPILDDASVRAELDRCGYGQWLKTEQALLTLVERYNAGISEPALTIGQRQDASFTLDVDANGMQAWLTVNPAFGGKKLEPDAVYMALGEAGVTFGIDEAVVGAACADNVAARVLAAAGVPPENGEDARFDLLVADARDRTPRLDDRGLIDFRDQGAIPTVSAEQPLMRRIPPTAGKAGRTVRGEVLEPVPGKNEQFAEDLVGACVAADDANMLRAMVSGQPVRCGNGVNVESVLQLRGVNMATGNIAFDGTVNIEGEVLPGMKVNASGDIVVTGVVDNAVLTAGGDIRVSGGIIAKSRVSAGGAVSVRFVENAQVQAGTNIVVEDSALQAELQANNQIIVGLKSTQRGRLAGGSARAMMLIRTPILGSSTSGVTQLLLGVNPVLEARYQELLHRIEKQREDEQNLEKLIKHLSKLPDKAALLERAKNSWQQALQGWAKLLPEREELERQLALVAGARVEVGAGIEGAIDLAFGKKVLRMRRAYGSGSLSIAGEQVVFTDAAGNHLPVS